MLLIAICASAVSVRSHAIDLETFTEPYRQVAVPASEMGVLSDVLVREGDAVTKSQLLAKLDDSVLQSSLKVAQAAKDATGAKTNATTELTLREQQLRGYRELFQKGNASQREVDRAENSYLQANTNLQTVREELDIRRLEYERTKVQLALRRILSPLDGVVVAVEKEAGEFVSPTDPVVMHVVQLNRLKAVFSVPLSMINKVQADQTVRLLIGQASNEATGIVELISPVANAESGSVRVKIRIENPGRTIPAGVLCRWDLDAPPPPVKSAKLRQTSRYE